MLTNLVRDTTSRGLYVRVWPPHTSVCLSGKTDFFFLDIDLVLGSLPAGYQLTVP